MLPQEAIYTKGDTINQEYQLFKNKCTNKYWDLTNFEIRYELKNGTSTIKKATENVVGGSNSQIEITDAIHGIFIVKISAVESVEFYLGDHDFEIEVTSATGEKTTVGKGEIRIVDEIITWTDED